MNPDRKAIYEQKVQETVIKLANLMIDNSVNGIIDNESSGTTARS